MGQFTGAFRLTCELFRLSELPEARIRAWRALADAHPAYDSPLLRPAFARMVAQQRKDAEVAVYRRGGRDVGFFPFHRRPGRFGRPIGGPFSDLHGPVLAEDAAVTADGLLRGAGLKAYSYKGLVDPFGVFASGREGREGSHRIVLEDTPGAYLEDRRAAHAKSFKNYRRLESKIEREQGELALIAGDLSAAHFEALLAFKHDQYRRTGAHDVLANPDNADILRRAFAARGGDFSGLMLTLTLNGTPVSGHFGVREGDSFHPWIAAYDAAFAAYSPGILIMHRAIAAMPALGLKHYELGAGHDHYKKYFAAEMRPLDKGIARIDGAKPSLAGAALGALEAHGTAAVSRAAARLRRGADHIAVAETGWRRRAGAISSAILHRGPGLADKEAT